MNYPVPAYPPPSPARYSPPADRDEAPGPVQAAAVLTWISAAGFGCLTVFAVILWFTFRDLDSYVPGHPRALGSGEVVFRGGGVVGILLGVLTSLIALEVVRRRDWARWALLVLWLLPIPVEVLAMLKSTQWLLVVGIPFAASGAVVVLLLLPSTFGWFREGAQSSG